MATRPILTSKEIDMLLEATEMYVNSVCFGETECSDKDLNHLIEAEEKLLNWQNSTRKQR